MNLLYCHFYQKLEIEQSNITRIEESTNECLINLES